MNEHFRIVIDWHYVQGGFFASGHALACRPGKQRAAGHFTARCKRRAVLRLPSLQNPQKQWL